MNKAKYQLSIILPIRNEEQFITQTLSQLLNQSLDKDKYEIIVVDGESTDTTKALVDTFIENNKDIKISFLTNPKRLSSAARNLGIKHASGEYLLIVDGHVYLPNPEVLKNSLNNALTTGAKVLGRPQPLNPPDTSDFQKAVALARTSKLAHSQESFIYSDTSGFVSPLSVAVMYHHSVFMEVGLFDENFDAAEDLEFNYRLEKADYECYFSSDHAIKYYPRNSISALFKQLGRYGLGRAKFFKKHPERFTWENIAPALLVILVLVTPLMLLISLPTKILWLLGGVSYFSMLLIESIKLKRSNSKVNTHAVTLAVIIATIHMGLGWGFIKGTILNLSYNPNHKPNQPSRSN